MESGLSDKLQENDKFVSIAKEVSETEAITKLKDASDNPLVELLQYNGGLGGAVIGQLCELAVKTPSITQLEVKSNSCGSLLKFLPNKTPIETDFSLDHPENLFYALSINKTIKTLRLSFTKTYNSLMLGLIYLFRINKNIEHLILEAVEIPSNFVLLIESLASNSTLQTLAIPTSTKYDIAPALKNTLEINKVLQSVTLRMGNASKDYVDRLRHIDSRITVHCKEGESSTKGKKKNKKKKKKKAKESIVIPTTSNESQQTGAVTTAPIAPPESKSISYVHKQKLRDIIYDIISSGEPNSLNSSDLKNVLSEFGEFSVEVNKSNKWAVTLKSSLYLEGFRLHREQLNALYQYLISLVKSNKDNALANFTAWVHQQDSVSVSISHFLELFPHTFARTDNFLKLLPSSAYSNIEQEVAQLTPNSPLHVNSHLFRNLIVLTSQNKKIKENIVEKDYYMTYILSRLAQTGFKFVLKGGTSLSKSWKLLPRVCEDVDLLVVGTEPWANESIVYAYHQIRKLRTLNYVNGNDEHKEYRRSIMQLMGDQICKKLVELDAKTFKKVEIMFDRSCQQLQLTIFYDPLFGPSGEEESFLLFPWIRIEISLDHIPDYYWLNSTVKSFVGEFIEGTLQLNPLVWFLNVFPVSVNFLSLDPRLTLLQKLFDCIILRYRRDISEEAIPYYSTPWVVPKSSEPQFDPRIVRHYEDAAFVLKRLSSIEAQQDIELFDVMNKLADMKWIDFFSNIKRQRLLRRNQFLLADELLHTESCFQLKEVEKLQLMQDCQNKRSCLYYTGVAPPSLAECTAVITDWFRTHFV